MNAHNELTNNIETKQPRLLGVLAEYENPDALLAAAAGVRDAGYSKWDAHSPFPIHGLSKAMGLKASKLQYVTIAAAATGAAAGISMQYWMNSIDYKYMLGGKPLFSVPAYIPVTFELTILFGALGVFAGLLAFTGLPKFYHAVFASRRFRRASSDGFFISVESGDPKFDAENTAALLASLGGANIEKLEG